MRTRQDRKANSNFVANPCKVRRAKVDVDAAVAHREAAAQRSRQLMRSVRDIGPIPEPKYPRCRSKALASFRYFCEHYFHGRFYLPWSDDHLKVLTKIEHCAVKGELYAFAMPRGSGKTSIMEVAALWAAFKGLHRYIAIIAATTHKAILLLDSIKAELRTNDRLAEDFPEVCYPIAQLEGVNQRSPSQLCEDRPTLMSWQARKLILPTIRGSRASGAIFHVAGLKSGDILGLKHTLVDDNGETSVIRPSFIMIDDPQTPESARSAAQTARREEILHGAVLGLAGPGKAIAAFALVTVIAQGDLADKILDRTQHPEWQGERFKLVYKFPTNEGLWTRYAQIRADRLQRGLNEPLENDFYRQHQAEMDKGAVVAWPARFDVGEISAIQNAMNLKLRNEAAFLSEYQNEPQRISVESVVITREEIVTRVSGYPRGSVHVHAEYLTAFIDCHDKLLFWTVVAWAPDFTGWIIDYSTWPDQGIPYFSMRTARRTLAMHARGAGREGAILNGIYRLAAELLDRNFRRADGTDMRIALCMLDASYERDTVYEFIRSCGRQNVMPYFGRFIGASHKPMAEYSKRPGERLAAHWMIAMPSRGERIRHVLSDVNYWKTFVHSRLAIAHGDPGALVVFGRDPREHALLADHLTAEYPVRTSGPWGSTDEWKWRADRPDNHWLDCLAGCACAASILGARLAGTQPQEQKSQARLMTTADLAKRRVRLK